MRCGVGSNDDIAPLAKQLPKLSSTVPSERLELFARKLHACCTCYSFDDANADVEEKEIKTIYLEEIVDYIDAAQGVLSHEPIYALSVVMLARNLFRSLPPGNPNYEPDPDDDDVASDPSWKHLEFVYKYFIRFLEAEEFQPSIAKKYMDARFVTRILRLFGSDDFRERNVLKTVLHRIYGKFLGLRATIRRHINYMFLSYLYDDQEFAGIAEVLEILGSIINGYVCPLKPEHLMFLEKVLIPLHTSKDLTYFQPQLVYCVVQYMEKDPFMAETIIQGLLKFWPKTCTPKEVMILGELEELIDAMQPSEFAKLRESILRQLSKCTQSEHFQVAERALFFWDNEYFVSLVEVDAKQSFPLVLQSLQNIARSHWNKSIQELATSVLKTMEELNSAAYNSVIAPPEKLSKSIRRKIWPEKLSFSRFL